MPKTDTPFLLIFQNNTELFTELAEIQTNLPYKLHSEEFKELKRTADGCFDCEEAKIAYITEFQAQKDDTIYERLELERIQYSLSHRTKDVHSILIFLKRSLDPKTEPWFKLASHGNPYFKVIYLDEALEMIAKTNPDHPLVQVFKVCFVKDDAQLIQEAPRIHQKLRNDKLPGRDVLLKVFEFWMLDRFQELNREGLQKMLGILENVKKSVAYQEIYQEGREEGRKENLKKAIAVFQRLLDQGKITKAEFEEMKNNF